MFKPEDLEELTKVEPFIKNLDPMKSFPNPTNLAFVSKTGELTTGFHTCKDYYHEMVGAYLNGISHGVCGYIYKEGNLDLDNMRLSVGEDPKFKHVRIAAMINLLNEIEAGIGLSQTKLLFGGSCAYVSPYLGKGEPTERHVWVLEGDKKWLHASPLVSFYCMCVRLGFDYDGSGWQAFLSRQKGYADSSASPRDRGYVIESGDFWKKLFSRSFTEVFGEDIKQNDPTGGKLAHGMGYLWMAQQKDYTAHFPHWLNLHKEG